MSRKTCSSACGAGAVVDELTGAQPDDALAVDLGEVEEVEVDDRRDAQLAVDALEVAHDDVAGRRVEAGHGLVGEQDRRAPGPARARCPRAAAGRPRGRRRGRRPSRRCRRAPGPASPSSTSLGPVPAQQRAHRARAVQPTHEHVVQDGRALHEVERLEDHADARADLAQLRGPMRVAHAHAVDDDVAAT